MKTVAQGIVLVAGLVDLLAGLALLFAPNWFFATVGNFPPFNQHYMGDAGAFVTALGVGLLVAARDLKQHQGIIGVAALGSLLHAGNHVYDDVIAGHWSPAHFFIDTVPLLVLAVLLIVAYRRATKGEV